MGDRAVIWIEGAPAALYLHWGGSTVDRLLQAAGGKCRRGDPSYAMARLIGAACAKNQGEVTGVGVLSPPTPEDVAEKFESYSHGDAGVFVIDATTGEVKTFAGYGWSGQPTKLEYGTG